MSRDRSGHHLYDQEHAEEDIGMAPRGFQAQHHAADGCQNENAEEPSMWHPRYAHEQMPYAYDHQHPHVRLHLN